MSTVVKIEIWGGPLDGAVKNFVETLPEVTLWHQVGVEEVAVLYRLMRRGRNARYEWTGYAQVE